jgi:alanine dehydrogenase
MYKTGVVKTSRKISERRVPIFPEHLPWISPSVRSSLTFENGYGVDFGYPDDYFIGLGARVASRDELFSNSELLIFPKPVAQDLEEMHEGQILWGWPHCVQQHAIAQAAIDRKITLIAWEAMHSWTHGGEKSMHIFYKNNELAGYCAIHHALEIKGIDGFYGPRRFVIILGYGSVARGAIHALHSRGFNNILVITNRPTHLVNDQHPDVYFSSFKHIDGLPYSIDASGETISLKQIMSEADIICNCVLQDTNHPIMYMNDEDIGILKNNSLIIDISCDEGMGFPFAKPTSFVEPTLSVGNGVTYYAVDHTPSYLWSAASREISKSLIPYLSVVMGGEDAWQKSEEIKNAIEIKNGIIVNKNIINFQKRSQKYPYLR